MYHASSDSVNTFFDRRQGQRTEKDTSTRKDIHDHAMVGHKNREGHGGGRAGGVSRTHSTLSVEGACTREGHGGGRGGGVSRTHSTLIEKDIGGGVCRTHSTLSVAEEVQEQMKQCQVSSCDQ